MAGFAGASPMQEQEVASNGAKLGRNYLWQDLSYRMGSFTAGNFQAVGDPKDMGIHRDGGLMKGLIKNDTGGFDSYPWEAFQLVTLVWDLRLEFISQNFACLQQMASFLTIKTRTTDQLL